MRFLASINQLGACDGVQTALNYMLLADVRQIMPSHIKIVRVLCFLRGHRVIFELPGGNFPPKPPHSYGPESGITNITGTFL